MSMREHNSQAKAEVARLLRGLDEAAAEEEGIRAAKHHVQDCGALGVTTTCRHAAASGGDDTAPVLATPAEPSFSQQYELSRLRRERDVAVADEHALLRQTRDAAVAEAQQYRAVLEQLQRELGELRQAHMAAQLKAAQQLERSSAELASKAESLERLQAGSTQLTACSQQQALRIEALETKQRVLLECYRALESEAQQARQQQCKDGFSSRHPAQHPLLQPTAVCQIERPPLARLGGCGSPFQHPSGQHPTTASWTGGGQLTRQLAAADVDPVERLAVSHSHLSLAVTCAELQFQLEQQTKQAAAAQQAAAAAQEQAAGLRLLLARQQVAGGPAALLQQRLEAACQQLDEAQRLGGQLKQQLIQRDQALRVAQQEKVQLQQDLQLMLAARGSLAALRANLQRAATTTAEQPTAAAIM